MTEYQKELMKELAHFDAINEISPNEYLFEPKTLIFYKYPFKIGDLKNECIYAGIVNTKIDARSGKKIYCVNDNYLRNIEIVGAVSFEEYKKYLFGEKK